MTKRKSISKKVRFEVFKRDSFSCQYCGRGAPDVILHVDHINPVAKGGESEVINYVTSCFDCNMGKGARTLDDSAVIKKQQAQLKDLNERREQLEMLLQWKQAIRGIEADQVAAVSDLLEARGGWGLSDHGKLQLKKHIKKFGISLVMDCADISLDQYLAMESETLATRDSFEKCINYIPKICAVKVREEKDPETSRLFYIRGIARNRLSYCNDWMCIKLLKEARAAGAPIDELQDVALSAKNWTELRAQLEECADYYGSLPGEVD